MYVHSVLNTCSNNENDQLNISFNYDSKIKKSRTAAELISSTLCISQLVSPSYFIHLYFNTLIIYAEEKTL